MLKDFERSFAVLNALPCDILLTAGDSTRVVIVDMGIENQPDIFDPDPQRANIRRYLRCAFLHGAVDEDVPCR